MKKLFKATFTNSEGEVFVDYLQTANQASAYKASGFEIEEVDENDVPEPKKGGRPRKETE